MINPDSRPKPNILFFAPADPDWQEKGSQQRTHRIHRVLQTLGEVYTIIPVFASAQEGIDPVRKVARVCAERRGSLRWWMRNLAQRVVPEIQMPCSVPLRRPSEWADVRFDAVVSRYLTLTGYFQTWLWGPSFVDLDDTPWEILSTADHTGAGKWLARLKVALMHKWAVSVFRHVRHVWVVRPDQVREVEGCPSVSVLPNLARPPAREPDPRARQERFFLTVGVLDHPPNHRGIDSFLVRHWPAISSAYPGWEYLVAGKNCPPAFARKWQRIPGVRLLGWVDDLDDLYSRAHAVFAPIESGSGSCIKVLEALLQARACLGPTFAMRAVPPEECIPRNGIFQCNSTEDYLAALAILQDDRTRQGIQESARRFVQQNWSEKAFAEEIRTTIVSSICHSSSPGDGNARRNRI